MTQFPGFYIKPLLRMQWEMEFLSKVEASGKWMQGRLNPIIEANGLKK